MTDTNTASIDIHTNDGRDETIRFDPRSPASVAHVMNIIADLCYSVDGHEAADAVLCSVAAAHGFGAAVAVFDEMEKWYN